MNSSRVPAPLRIRSLIQADLSFAHSLSTLAAWNQTLPDWHALLRHDPDGCFLAELHGQPAGTVTTTAYSAELAWIGMLLVHPDCRGCGIGQALLRHAIDFLRHRGIRCLKLDATPAGKPLYEKIGFRTEWTLRRWESSPPAPARQSAPCRVRAASPEDHAAVVRLDGRAFGVERPRWLLGLVERSQHALVCLQSASPLQGFALVREGAQATYLGPIVATSAEAGAALAHAAFDSASAQRRCFWDVPDANRAAQDWLVPAGFREQRQLTRMYLGENIRPSRVGELFGISGPETG